MSMNRLSSSPHIFEPLTPLQKLERKGLTKPKKPIMIAGTSVEPDPVRHGPLGWSGMGGTVGRGKKVMIRVRAGGGAFAGLSSLTIPAIGRKVFGMMYPPVGSGTVTTPNPPKPRKPKKKNFPEYLSNPFDTSKCARCGRKVAHGQEEWHMFEEHAYLLS